MANGGIASDRGTAYSVTKGTEKTTGSATKGWYIITGKATSSSIIPAALSIDDLFYTATSVTLASGDKLVPLTLTEIGWVKVANPNFTKSSEESTSWSDKNKSYVVSRFSEGTFTMSGRLDPSDDFAKKIQSQFIPVITIKGTVYTKLSETSEVIRVMISVGEKGATTGDIVQWRYLPHLAEGLNTPQDSGSLMTFEISGKLQGSENPQIVNIEV